MVVMTAQQLRQESHFCRLVVGKAQVRGPKAGWVEAQKS